MSHSDAGSKRALDSAEHDAARLREHEQVQRAARGDAQAFRALVERHYSGMYALALRMVGDKSEAEDLVQESFEHAFCRLTQFNTSYRLSTWLYRIVLNSCRDHLKSPRRKERPSGAPRLDPYHQPAEPDPWLVVERSQQLYRAIEKLGPRYSQIVMLKDVLELSYEEIHALTGTSVTGLKIRAIRARNRLRELLRAEASEE